MLRSVGGHDVRGLSVDADTRCCHYDSKQDVVAFRFACCQIFFPCYKCHEATVDHTSQPLPSNRFGERAVLCGVCGGSLTAFDYLEADYQCPSCNADFNPGCQSHLKHYFKGM